MGALFAPEGPDCIANATVPGTVLWNLIQNGTFGAALAAEPYTDALLDSLVPDISVTGADYYSFTFGTSVVFDGSVAGHWTLQLGQQNYRLRVYLDSTEVLPVGSSVPAVGMFQRLVYALGSGAVLGRASHALTFAVSPPDHYGNTSSSCPPHNCGQGGNHALAQDVTSQYTAGWDWVGSTADRNTGLFDTVDFVQTPGNVLLRDAVAVTRSAVAAAAAAPSGPADCRAQCDGGVPPSVATASDPSLTALELAAAVPSAAWLAFDPAAQQRRLLSRLACQRACECEGAASSAAAADPPPNLSSADAVDATVEFVVAVLCLDPSSAVGGTLSVAVPALGGGTLASVSVSLPPDGSGLWRDVSLPPVVLRNVSLWWPHTLGTPVLYDAVLTFTPAAAPPATAAAVSLPLRFGVRTVDSAVDPVLGGRAFSVNGVRVFLQGGNWIAADQLNRFVAAPQRYAAEVRLHRDAGLNLIRLWGGAGGNGAALLAAADAAGVLLMHEFWMSGDNNGRWGGNYSWPLDHSLYLAAAADTVRAFRGHPSLLFWCGGNELYPAAESPPADIAAGLRALLGPGGLDPSLRPYVPSSMTNATDFDPEAALAPRDGPYGVLDERRMFTRNPGLRLDNGSRADALLLAFQPEIGSAACPEAESLRRFLSPAALAAFPGPRAAYNETNPAWQHHRFLPFTDDDGVDHVYAYAAGSSSSIANTSEYAWRAQLAQHRQYCALFEGFQEHQWLFYSAVVMWKTQGPWPAFRGALYDSYLAATGGLWGTRAATGGGAALHAQLNLAAATMTVLNKGMRPVSLPQGVALQAVVTAWDIATGRQAMAPPLVQPVPAAALGAGAVLRLPAPVVWPASAPQGATLLFRVQLQLLQGIGATTTAAATTTTLSSSDVWLSTLSPLGPYPNATEPQDYAALGTVRDHASPLVLVANASCAAGAVVVVSLANPAGAAAVAFAVRVSLRYRAGSPAASLAAAAGDDRVLPAFATGGYLSLVPGEGTSVAIETPAGLVEPVADTYVLVDGWNVAPLTVPVVAV